MVTPHLTIKQKHQYRWRQNRGMIEMAKFNLTSLSREFFTPTYFRMTQAQLESLCSYLHRLNDSRAIELGLNIKRWGVDDEG